MLMAALPTDLHLYSEDVGLVQHAQWCLWADPLTQSEQVGERPRLRVEHIADSARLDGHPPEWRAARRLPAYEYREAAGCLPVGGVGMRGEAGWGDQGAPRGGGRVRSRVSRGRG